MPARTTVDTPLGPFTMVVGPGGVLATAFGEWDADALPPGRDDRRGLAAVRREIEAYFAGRLRRFETPSDLSSLGDGFARRALEVVRTIPYGELWTYGDVAAAAGVPRGGRAAGSALARCPIELFVPCHRVVRAGPDLGRYGRHDDRRRFLLALEGSLPGVRARA
ncbi:MAG TPA: methylated-DNA--[protein]-cysteine S-methyltransferase [Actinomycetota bacterium]|nr:methylated-DNA--[protein]-cysteine S-methyltransferase [Actinomycetota bacterium]